MEFITVLVSVKNKEATIEKCLNSILSLDWPQKRILVIDNFSDDRTAEILEKFGDKIEVFKKSGGLSEVFNWALEKVETKYLAVTDADCVVDRNWIKELLKPFSQEKNLAAVAGYCGTPADVSFFQKLIGMELENRFKKFPKYIDRSPTMNICLNVEIAKKVKFDEGFVYQAFEADFFYRLKKAGNIFYNPQAKICHYHRSNIWSYFLQQKNQAKWGVKLLLKHGKKAMVDQITTFWMSLQIPIFAGLAFFLFISVINNYFIYFSLFFLIFLIFLYFKNIFEIKPPFFYYPFFIFLFFMRTIAWCIGATEGAVFLFVRQK